MHVALDRPDRTISIGVGSKCIDLKGIKQDGQNDVWKGREEGDIENKRKSPSKMGKR